MDDSMVVGWLVGWCLVLRFYYYYQAQLSLYVLLSTTYAYLSFPKAEKK
jgi:hypothetical protein